MMTAEILDDLDALALDSPARAHEEARRRVAENPNSEEAALQLRDLIRKYPPVSLYPSPDPLEGAAPAVRRAAELLEQDKAEEAEIGLRAYLKQAPNDPSAMRLMAQIAMANGFLDNAYKILVRSLEIDRTRADNWTVLGKVLHRIASSSGDLKTIDEAIAALDQAARITPFHHDAVFYKTGILIQIRRLQDAGALLDELLGAHPQSTYAWTSRGFVHKTLGDFAEAVAAYRTAVAIDPANSEAWWGLANLKRAKLHTFDVEEIERQLSEASDKAEVSLHFALATAYDQAGDFERAAEHLQTGTRLRLQMNPHDVVASQRAVQRCITTYTKAYFERRKGSGDPSDAPIFVVSMPRSGSTLVEQILASHSMIEGTEELFGIQQIQSELSMGKKTATIEETIAELDGNALAEMGRYYLHLTRHQRKGDRPHFTDKNPANWRELGLIHSILPNAKIIDVRRNPMDCCFGNYSQHFNLGANFSYGQKEVALFYRDYLQLMRHFDTVLPGVVHRVIYDDLVDDFEREVRRLLDFLQLPFEENCLRFFETKRAIHTPSSEQVRQPINKSGLGRWRNYDPWLSEMRESLGHAQNDWRS
jgi:tetratricopeptide (TPR) repeat protein